MTAIKWRTGAGGNWNLAGNWTPASIPGSSDDATIDATGTYVVTISSAEAAKSLTVNDATATVDLTASLSLSGTLALNAGTVDLAYGGLINGGTIHAVAGILQANGGTLQGVTDQGTLDLSASGSRLYATGGLTLTGAGGTGPGMLLLTGSGSQLEIASAMTLDNATIDIGSANSDSVLELANSGGTLTLGSRLDLQQVGAYAEFYTPYVSDTIINQGTIAAGISGGDFYFNYGTLVNKGTIDVSADDTLDLRNAVLQNSGLVIVDDATLMLGAWTSTGGTIEIETGTLDLTGSLTTAQLKAIAMVDATVEIAGALDNTGATLSIGYGAPIESLILAGTITAGVIADPNGALIANGGTLSAVTYQGTLDLSPQSTRLTVTGGLTMTGAGGTGPGTVLLTGSGSDLYVAGSMTLNNATIDIGASTASYLYLSSSGMTLTLASKFDLQQTGAKADISAYYSNDALVNQGTISAGVSGGDFVVTYGTLANQGTITVSNGDTFDASSAVFSNTGTVTVNDATLLLGTGSNNGKIAVNGGTLSLGGSFTTAQLKSLALTDATIDITGTLDNTGAALAIGPGLPIAAVNLSGTITKGVIADPGGNLTVGSGTLNGVTYEGTLDLGVANSYLNVTGGLTLTGAGGVGPGTVLLTGSYSRLYVASSTTLNNATIDIGAVNNWSYLEPSTSGVTLTLGPQLNLQQVGADAEVYQPYTGDALVNQGTIAAAVSGGKFVIGYGTLTNQGTIAVSNGDSFDLSQLANFTNLSGTTLSGGTVTVGAGSVLQLANNATLGTDHADITLDGTGSVIESESTSTYKQVALDATLSTIAAGGTLALLDGRGFTAIANAGTFTDAGTLLLGGSTFAATALTLNGGTIAGIGTIAAPIAILGTAHATGDALALNGTATGAGVLAVAAGALVDLNAGGTLTGSVTDAGTVALSGGTVTAASLTIAAGGVLTGFGTWNGTVTDGGLVDASGGTLHVAGLAGLSGVTWSGKAIEADAASALQLANNTSIAVNAGTIVLSGAGSVIEALNTTTAKQVTLDQTLGTIAAGGTLALLGGRSFTAVANAGAFADLGALVLGGGTFGATKLSLGNGAAIVGSGTVNAATTVTGTVVLSGGTLALMGSLLGTGTLSVAAGELLLLDAAGTAFAGTLSDAGTVQLAGAGLAAASVSVVAGGTIAGFGTITGPVTNAGLLDAHGGTLSVTGLAGLGTGTLGKGTLEADAASVLQLTPNTAIGTIAGAVTLSGAGSLIEALNTTTSKQVSLDTTLATIAAGGTLSIQTGRSFAATGNAGAITDAGLLSIGAGAVFSAKTLTVAAGGTLLDAGSFTGALVNNGTVSIAAGTVLTLTGGGSLGGLFTGAGTLRLTGATPFTMTAATQLAPGLVQVAAGATLSGAGTIAAPLDDAGTVIASGGTLALDGALTSAGTLTAAAGAVLKLADGGTFFGAVTGAGTVVNADAVYGASFGVSLAGTGTLSVTNAAGGEIDGGNGAGVVLAGGTVVVNNAGAIGGITEGLHLSGASASVVNSGLITGDDGAAILGSGPGSITITNNGLIANYEGMGVAAISLSGAASATVTNSGTIIGGYFLPQGAPAIQFGFGNDRLIVLPGAVFVGAVNGGGGVNTLELAAGSAPGAIAGLGTSVRNFGSVVVDAGAAWSLGASNTIGAGSTLAIAAGATLSLPGTLVATGGAIGGAGTFDIVAGGTFEAEAPTAATVAVGSGKLTDLGLLDVNGGGTLNIAGATLTNLSAGVVTGGTFEVDGASTLQLAANAAITTDNASIVLNGVGGSVQWLNTATSTTKTLAQTLATIGATGTLDLANGAHFTAAGALAVQGQVELGGATIGATAFTVGAAGAIIGSGTVAGGIADTGLVEATGGALTVTGDITGSGTIAIDSDAVLTADGKLGSATMTFLQSDGELVLAKPSQATATISDFGTSDLIDLQGAVATKVSFAANVLTVTGASGTLATLHFTGNFGDYGFGYVSDGHGGSFIQLV